MQEVEQQRCEDIGGQSDVFALEFFYLDMGSDMVGPLALLLGYI